MSSQGVMSSKETNNNLGLCPVRGQQSGLSSWTSDRNHLSRPASRKQLTVRLFVSSRLLRLCRPSSGKDPRYNTVGRNLRLYILSVTVKAFIVAHWRLPISLKHLGIEISAHLQYKNLQTNQPTRCISLSDLLPVVEIQLNTFRASSCPSSGAYKLQ